MLTFSESLASAGELCLLRQDMIDYNSPGLSLVSLSYTVLSLRIFWQLAEGSDRLAYSGGFQSFSHLKLWYGST